MARVRLEGVRKIYDGPHRHVAVHGVDLEIADGEFVVLVGPSGSGKSTTLRMIAGLESISDGRLFIGERLVNDVAPKERDIAMVFQNYALYPHMSVYDNLAFALTLRRVAKPEIDRRVREVAAILGIDAVLARKPRQLSGGQRQRVALGRAIVREPQVFLFDEPLSNLDAKLRVQMRRELSQLHDRLGATMVYVTHDQVEAMTLGDRIVVMHEGKVQQIDAPLALYERPANVFVAGFIGSPPMNFLPGRVEANGAVRFRTDSGLEIPLTGAAAAVAAHAGRPVIIGVRPEHLRIGDGANAAAAPISGRVELIEPTGSEVLVHASVNGQTLTARVEPRSLPREGEPVRLDIDTRQLHFFDAATEQRIATEPAR